MWDLSVRVRVFGVLSFLLYSVIGITVKSLLGELGLRNKGRSSIYTPYREEYSYTYGSLYLVFRRTVQSRLRLLVTDRSLLSSRA